MDTTGQMIVTHTDSGTRLVIAIDNGPYPGCKPEYNVRALRDCEYLDLSLTSQAYSAITDRGNGYGCKWGDSGQLYPIDAADAAALRRDLVASKVARAMTMALYA